MKKPIFYYTEGHPHCDDYRIGPPPCSSASTCHPCTPPAKPQPYYHGKVSVTGRTVLTVKYLDRHNYYQTFDIRDGETYEITAVSSTRGICKFAGRIVDFECNKGIEKLLDKPHEITISALIVDYSDAYESKLIRMYTNNIVSIKPIKCFDGEMNYPTECDCDYSSPDYGHECHHDEEPIYDPFE
jgi:hypothetical protein